MFDIFALSRQGQRKRMENTLFCNVDADSEGAVWGGVFDGHFGARVARYAKDQIAHLTDLSPGDALRNIHSSCSHLKGGATAVVFRLSGDDLLVANLGDAAAVKVNPSNGNESATIEHLSELHRIENGSELSRFQRIGTPIRGPYIWNVQRNLGLMVTRALGDYEFADLGVTGNPYECNTTFSKGWLVVACDGLWDVMEPDEIHQYLHGNAREIAIRLAKEALIERNSEDNLSLIVLRK